MWEAQSIMGGVIPVQVYIPGLYTIKWSEQAMGKKPVSSISPQHQLMPWISALTSLSSRVWPERVVSQNKPFPLQVAFGYGILSQWLRPWLQQRDFCIKLDRGSCCTTLCLDNAATFPLRRSLPPIFRPSGKVWGSDVTCTHIFSAYFTFHKKALWKCLWARK